MRLVGAGELFGFGYLLDRPLLHYFVLDPKGRPKFDAVIPLPEVSMMHDFAITEDYAIFLDFPMVHRRKVLSPNPHPLLPLPTCGCSIFLKDAENFSHVSSSQPRQKVNYSELTPDSFTVVEL